MSFWINRSFGADLVFTQFAFDGFPVQTIPEPGPWLMLAVGLLALTRARRPNAGAVECQQLHTRPGEPKAQSALWHVEC